MKFWSPKNPFVLLAVVAAFVALVFLLMAGLAWVFDEDAEARVPERSTYATCYNLRGTMANGRYVHKRAAASNVLPLGKKIRITSRHAGPGGIRRYIVSDTGGQPLNDGHLDLWSPGCYGWPNPRITYKFGWSP